MAKRLLGLLVFGFLLTGSLQAQPHNRDSMLVSRHRPGLLWYNTGWRPAKEGMLRKYDRLIFDITYNNLLDPNWTKNRFFSSIGWNVNTMWDIPLEKGNKVSLGIGLAYKHQKVGTAGFFAADSTMRYTQFYPDTSYNGASQVRFGNHQVVLPIELRFRQNRWQHVKLHIGGSIGYRFSTYQKYEDANGRFHKDKKLPDVNRLVYGAHIRFGVRNWALFADYAISPNFRHDKSSKIQGLSFGISVSLF